MEFGRAGKLSLIEDTGWTCEPLLFARLLTPGGSSFPMSLSKQYVSNKQGSVVKPG